MHGETVKYRVPVYQNTIKRPVFALYALKTVPQPLSSWHNHKSRM